MKIALKPCGLHDIIMLGVYDISYNALQNQLRVSISQSFGQGI